MSFSTSTDEINYLVYRYLLESGFEHSAYLFGMESNIQNTSINHLQVPVGSLLTLIQKALQYIEVEALVDDPEMKLNTSLSLIDAVKPEMLESKRTSKPQGTVQPTVNRRNLTIGQADQQMIKSEPTEQDSGQPIDPSKVTVLKGHQSEIFICSWNPQMDVLASGSGDATARIWNLKPDAGPSPNHLVLTHNPDDSVNYDSMSESQQNDQQGSITTLDWSKDGQRLATGSYDGIARIWSTNGQQISALRQHAGPIFALRWNPSGTYVLSAGIDKSTIVWNPTLGVAVQQFCFHSDPALDVDWQSDTMFASCSTDKCIHVCKLHHPTPVKTFRGHENEVNAVRWSPQGHLLASCADDQTLKIWSMASDRYLHSLSGHDREIYQIRWSPSGPDTANPNAPLWLASASFDATIRLWDAEVGKSVRILRQHTEPVYSVAFAPDARILASGSLDKHVYIWDVNVGRPVRRFECSGGVYEACFNAGGQKVGAACADGTVFVLDLRSTTPLLSAAAAAAVAGSSNPFSNGIASTSTGRPSVIGGQMTRQSRSPSPSATDNNTFVQPQFRKSPSPAGSSSHIT